MDVAAIIGSHGAIGSAIASKLEATGKYDRIIRLSRHDDADITINITQEESVANAALQIAQHSGHVKTCIIASGLLHNTENSPEKSAKDIDAAWMAQIFAANSIGPALVAKHFLPLMPRKESFHFAAISARVGSISDNGLGGWYSYRASKAALNMLIKNFAIEWARKNDKAVITCLHPGTVDSNLSKPFQSNVADHKLFTPEYSAEKMIDLLLNLTALDSGKHFAWDGQEIPA